ncbi:sodium/proton antiporter (CPA1 family) [Blastococcus colisei]|uniref:Sodium/proton antiporter (CPA1 family) n=1 Tax=Blastococcus colisei TaxID=1564162 RepID=A0A543PG70_9ACTN|nr:cation:proton antiporter [Blastococcus colisei]TQN43080.1 sodium/proton antiporter (CPA1 family) [Blastococcus colisei]
MELLLVFAVLLFVAVLISGLAHRTILSTAVLFLVAGFVLGDGVTGVLALGPDDEIVVGLAELALFSVLYTDGMRVGFSDLRSAWRLPGRALVLGMPLTFAVTAVLAYVVAGLSWTEAMLVGAVLAPTDPVFASAIVGRPEVPGRLRSLLNVESGVNDGLALPVVLVLISVLSRDGVSYSALATELALGIALGFAVPAVAVLLLRSRFTSSTPLYASLSGLSIGLMVLGAANLTHANLFLAAFTAGITIASFARDVEESFAEFGELVTELLKLAAILVFGALISPAFLGEIPVTGYVFAVLALLLARPVAIGISLLGSGLPRPERAAAAWFGPKGFASVVYGLLILDAGVPGADAMFHLVALVIVASILAHSSTDVPIAHAFARAEARQQRAGGETIVPGSGSHREPPHP